MFIKILKQNFIFFISWSQTNKGNMKRCCSNVQQHLHTSSRHHQTFSILPVLVHSFYLWIKNAAVKAPVLFLHPVMKLMSLSSLFICMISFFFYHLVPLISQTSFQHSPPYDNSRVTNKQRSNLKRKKCNNTESPPAFKSIHNSCSICICTACVSVFLRSTC